MGAEVSIYGLVSKNMVGHLFPRIAAYHQDMGLGRLAESLRYTSRDRPDILEEHTEDTILGVYQYLVLNPRNLAKYVEDNHRVWDSVGMGFRDGIQLMQDKPELTWWFHVCF